MDQETKLFEKNIMLPEDGSDSPVEIPADGGYAPCSGEIESFDGEKNLLDEEDQEAETSEINAPELSESNGQPTTLKKPDKILPCPRCSSMETKFCYYNNYNISQPRHFCKSCQRYWTAGGIMRNIPVGAGRRKTKNSTSNCSHITIPESLNAARVEDPSSFHLPAAKPSSTVLSLGPDSTPGESIASDLELADKSVHDGLGNRVSNGIDCSSQGAQQIPNFQNINGFSSSVPCIPSFQWPFPWNSCVPLPALYPVPFFPPPYWNCAVPNPWTVPWLPVSSTDTGSVNSLGKHSRSGELLNTKKMEPEDGSEPDKLESSIVVPKTLRIDDPEEAAKSSIWETLGIEYGCNSREGLFRAFQPKEHKEKIPHSNSQALQANPAALSRSISFQENS